MFYRSMKAMTYGTWAVRGFVRFFSPGQSRKDGQCSRTRNLFLEENNFNAKRDLCVWFKMAYKNIREEYIGIGQCHVK